MASDLAIKTAQRAIDGVHPVEVEARRGLRLTYQDWGGVAKLIEWAVDEALNEVVGEDDEGSLCRTTYSILDELHEQLTEAAQHMELATSAGRESAAILIADLGSVDRVRKLIREIVDPRDL